MIDSYVSIQEKCSRVQTEKHEIAKRRGMNSIKKYVSKQQYSQAKGYVAVKNKSPHFCKMAVERAETCSF